MRSDLRSTVDDLAWVADGHEHYLAHLAPVDGVDFSLCGLDLGGKASERKAEDRPRCSACVDCREGKINGWWF